MVIKIRKPKHGDEKGLLELDKQFWEIHSSIDPFIELKKDFTEKDYLKNAKKVISNRRKNNFYFVAELDSKIVGLINFQIQNNDKLFKLEKYGYLDLVIVNKKYRKLGIGKTLIDSCLSFLQSKHIRAIKFHTNWNNPGAIDAFRKLGFIEKNIMFYKELK